MQRRDNGAPEIKDYSNASPWEDFAAIQEVVRD